MEPGREEWEKIRENRDKIAKIRIKKGKREEKEKKKLLVRVTETKGPWSLWGL